MKFSFVFPYLSDLTTACVLRKKRGKYRSSAPSIDTFKLTPLRFGEVVLKILKISSRSKCFMEKMKCANTPLTPSIANFTFRRRRRSLGRTSAGRQERANWWPRPDSDRRPRPLAGRWRWTKRQRWSGRSVRWIRCLLRRLFRLQVQLFFFKLNQINRG